MQALCSKEGRNAKKAVVEQLGKLFAEASNLFPLDATLHESATEVGEMLQHCGQREIVLDLKVAFEKLMEKPLDNADLIHEGLMDLEPKIQGVTMDQGLLQKECGDVLKDVYHFCLKILDGFCSADDEMGPVVVTAAECLTVLAGWLAQPEEIKLAKKIRADVAVCGALQELSAARDDEGEFVVKAQALQRRMESSKGLGDLKTWKVQMACFKPLLGTVSKAEAALSKCCGEVSTKNKQKVIGLVHELSQHAGGLPGGEDWLASYKENDWASLCDHAALTLLTQDAPAVLAVHNQLQEAWSCHRGIRIVGGCRKQSVD